MADQVVSQRYAPENGPMVSETSICNQALSWLGLEPITSLSDESNNAIWMRGNYSFLRDTLLELRMWSWAQAKAISEVEDLDPWGDKYEHPIPEGWLQVFRVYTDVAYGKRTALDEWEKQGRFILTREKKVYMWGVRRETDTGRFSLLFVQALAARLAADAALGLTGNRALASDMWNLYEAKLGDAATRDGQQGRAELITSESGILARGQGGYIYGR